MPKNNCRRGTEVKNLLKFELPGHVIPPSRGPSYHRSTLHKSIDSADWKRLFILQNFQFIVRQDVWASMLEQRGICQGKRKLVESLRCGDVLAPWNAIHSVLMRAPPEQFECRICFDYPVAPRVTECGHLFCLPCLLQYLEYQRSNNKSRICPVCQGIIVASMLKPCTLQPVSVVTPRKVVRFDLYKRSINSVQLLRHDSVVEPRGYADVCDTTNNLELPLYMSPHALHSRYVLSTKEHEINQQHLDREGLMERLKMTAEFVRPFTQYDDMTVRSIDDAIREVMSVSHDYSTSFRRTSPPLALGPPQTEENKKIYEIYAESESGQPFYVHMLSMKMLMHDAKIRDCPLQKSFKAEVVEIVTLRQTEKLRCTHKVFSHIPLHGYIHLCILNLEGVVSRETIDAFKDDLKSQEERHARVQESARASSHNDVAWRQHVAKHSTGAAASHDIESWSDLSCKSKLFPCLQLPSATSTISLADVNTHSRPEIQDTTQHCDGSTTTPQEENRSGVGDKICDAAKRQQNCWSSGNACKLFTKPSLKQGASPTWGGHSFCPH